MVAVPGIHAARRFAAVDGELARAGRQRFLALYEFADTTVLASDAWADAATTNPRTDALMPRLTWASQLYLAVGSGDR